MLKRLIVSSLAALALLGTVSSANAYPMDGPGGSTITCMITWDGKRLCCSAATGQCWYA
jgi:hypothetical protein